jgi:1,4-dihydroxy-6-naphthoate synthase
MHLTLGFSPCPNDTFIFDALVHGKVDTEGLKFDVQLEDVETLNQRAFAGEIDVTKLSYHAYAYLTDYYVLLDSGSALGRGVGPLLVAKTPMSDDAIRQARIAIPGRLTTANFLFSLAYPEAHDKCELVFSEIEEAVVNGDADTGLIIHENRFTYQQKGLVRLADLGEYWENLTGLPIPLGGIVANRALKPEVRQAVNRALRRSVEYAFAHTADVMPYVRCYAQAMDEAVMKQHIDLYVNHHTVDLGAEGRAAVDALFAIARQREIIPEFTEKIFLD